MGHIDPAAYDAWYHTPLGSLCHRLERDALFSLTTFKRGEAVLDAGCGTMLIGFLNRNSPWASLRMEKGIAPASVWHGVRFYSLPEIAGLAFKAGFVMRGFKGAVHFPPDVAVKEPSALEVMEAEGRQNSPSSAAFFGVTFAKTR